MFLRMGLYILEYIFPLIIMLKAVQVQVLFITQRKGQCLERLPHIFVFWELGFQVSQVFGADNACHFFAHQLPDMLLFLLAELSFYSGAIPVIVMEK
jgi:hypothetical protein